MIGKNIIFFLICIFILSCTDEVPIHRSSIYINLGSEPETIDPSLNVVNSTAVYIQHAFEGLTKIGPDNTIESGMAKSWKISENGLNYVFYLKTNVKWSDGRIVTAYDFEYAWKRVLNPSVKSKYAYIMDVVKNAQYIRDGVLNYQSLAVKAIDNHTLVVNLEYPAPYFLSLIATASPFFPLRRDIIERYGDLWALSPETYISNGPYKLKLIKKNEKMTFEVNTNYYSMDSQLPLELTFIFNDNPKASIIGVTNGGIHFSALEPPPESIDALNKNGFLVKNSEIGVFYISINVTNGVLKDRRVRHALALSIDRNYIVSNITKTGQLQAGAFVPFGIKGYNGDFRDNSKNYIDYDNHRGNIAKAKQLLSAAGYRNGAGFPILEVKIAKDSQVPVYEAIIKMWKENLNIDVRLVKEDIHSLIEDLTYGNYQLARFGWTAEYNDPMSILEIMASSSLVNFSRFSNKNYDDIISYAKNFHDEYFRYDAMREAEGILMDFMPIIPLFYRVDYLIVDPKLQGVIYSPIGTHKFNYSYTLETIGGQN